MTAALINGTQIAREIQDEVELEVASLKATGINPGLAVVLVGEDPASASYVGMKARMCDRLGMTSKKLVLSEDIEESELISPRPRTECGRFHRRHSRSAAPA